MARLNKVLLVLNGTLNKKFLVAEAKKYSFILAADGGANKCLKAGVKPSLVVGDLDSITSKNKTLLRGRLKQVLRQDNSDFEKALDYLKTLKPKQVDIALFYGGRIDFGLSNFLTASNYLKYFDICFLFPKAIVYLLSKGAEIKAKKGARVSIIPFEEIKNISTHNLLYPLKDETLGLGQRGLSNIALGNFIINFKRGKLLVYVEKY
ncbi:MAG: thiamine diphosphokinase [Elusimicrobiaceae bacterium]|nr:thiamine diphosphokinase [Elusimicrobiaceae bacterium]